MNSALARRRGLLVRLFQSVPHLGKDGQLQVLAAQLAVDLLLDQDEPVHVVDVFLQVL